jgi:2-keto-3-deoxy-L-fuconate dehydrogenase
MTGRLEGKRVLVTHADRCIGPPVVELFRAEGAGRRGLAGRAT